MDFPKMLLVTGIGISLVALILMYVPGILGWFGNLPGDVNYKNEKVSVFIPITSMLLLSVIFSLIMYFLKR